MNALFLVVAVALWFWQPVQAISPYCYRIPNGANFDFDACALIGHTTKTGRKGVNPFGQAFADADLTWTFSLCQEDSDGDGQTNGQELGDPCCLWNTTNGMVQYWSGLSNPGNSSEKVDDSLWQAINCSDASTFAKPSPTSTTQPDSTTTATPSTATALLSQSSASSGLVRNVFTSISVALAIAQILVL